MARKTTKKEPFQDTLKRILEAENATYEEAGIGRQFIVSFPNRQKPPLLGRIGVKLLTMSGGIIQMQYHKRDNQ